MAQTDTRDPYLLEKLRRAIAEDPRVGEPAVRVFGAGGRIWLEGTVLSEERKQAAEELVHEIVPGVEVKNELDVITIGGPTTESVHR